MDLANLAIDLKKEEEGAWIKVDEETELLIARIGNDRYVDLQSQLIEKYVGLGKDVGKQDILPELMAKTILLGWKNLKMDGEELVYSVDTAFKILANPENKAFRDLVFAKANNMENYRKKKEGEIAKN